MNRDIETLSLVSTALAVLDKYNFQELMRTMDVRGIKSVKKEIDHLLAEMIVHEAQSQLEPKNAVI